MPIPGAMPTNWHSTAVPASVDVSVHVPPDRPRSSDPLPATGAGIEVVVAVAVALAALGRALTGMSRHIRRKDLNV